MDEVLNESPYIIELNDVCKKFPDSDVYAVENFNLKNLLNTILLKTVRKLKTFRKWYIS